MKSERISPFWVNGYQPFSAWRISRINHLSLDVSVSFMAVAIYGSPKILKIQAT